METDQIEAELEAAVASAQRYLPDWATAILVYLVGALIALALFRFAFSLLNRAVAKQDLFWRSLVGRGASPLRLVLLIGGLGIANEVAPVAPNINQAFAHRNNFV